MQSNIDHAQHAERLERARMIHTQVAVRLDDAVAIVRELEPVTYARQVDSIMTAFAATKEALSALESLCEMVANHPETMNSTAPPAATTPRATGVMADTLLSIVRKESDERYVTRDDLDAILRVLNASMITEDRHDRLIGRNEAERIAASVRDDVIHDVLAAIRDEASHRLAMPAPDRKIMRYEIADTLRSMAARIAHAQRAGAARSY